MRSLGVKKTSINHSQNKSKITPQTSRYSTTGMERYFKFKQSQPSAAELNEQQKQIKKVKSLKNLKSCNNGVQKSKKLIRGQSPMVVSNESKKNANNVFAKQLQVMPLSVRESTRYPSQTSISTSISTKNQAMKQAVPIYDIENSEQYRKF